MARADRLTLARLFFVISVMVLMTAAATSARQQAAADANAVGRLDAQVGAAERLLNDRNWDEARTAFESALATATQIGNVDLEGRALVGLTQVSFNTLAYGAARDLGLRALAVAERLGKPAGVGIANTLLSLTANVMGDQPEARRRAELAVTAYEATDDRRGLARATLALLRTGPPDSPGQPTVMELAIERAGASGDVVLEGEAAHVYGDQLFARGDYARALVELERAAAAYTAGAIPESLGAVYNSVGRVYRAHGQLQVALDYQLKALELHERGTSAFLRMQSLNAVAAVYGMLGEIEKARSHTERALKVAEQSGSPRIQDFLRANLATYVADEGDYSRAVELLEGVIARGLDTFVNRRHQPLSYALGKLGRTEDALRAAEKGVALCTGGGDEDCSWALHYRAQAHIARGDTAAAISDVTSALARIEDARTRLVPSDFFKRDFLRQRDALFSLAVALQVRQGRGADALETAELARSRGFIDLLASRDLTSKGVNTSTATGGSAVQPPTSATADPLATLALTMRGAGTGDTSSVSIVPSTDQHMSSVTIAAPARAADLVAVAKRLRSTLLVYWVATDEIYIWVVAPAGVVRAVRVEVLATRLARLVRETAPFASQTTPPAAGTITTRGGEQFRSGDRSNAWRELYDLLVRPVLADLPSASGSLLTIVPHGPLAGLSFAALQNERGRYLLEDHALHYASAGAVLQFTGASHRANARSGALLVVADPLLPRAPRPEPSLPALPGARIEAREIAQQFPRQRTTMLIGSDASETRVTGAIAQKSAVHFATHAIVRDDAPFDSYLALAADGTAADGRLTAQDIYRLSLDADLVVLSACRSASGRVAGDGVAAFARAFIYAGAPSVVASLWDVPDTATSQLIAAFYRSWLAGTSKSSALRSAQLSLLRDLRAGRVSTMTAAGSVVLPEHPIFWAGFSLIGEPD